jgi:hypothetical protein
LRWAISSLAVLVVVGCGLVTDVFNSALATQLGLDPATVIPPKGTILVAFKNDTAFPAVFSAYKANNAQNLSLGARNFTVQVAANNVGNEVLECPVALVSPGALTAGFVASGSSAAIVQTATGSTTVAYTGQALVSGTVYTCGDVIEIRLSASAAATSQPSGQQASGGLTVGGQATTGQTTTTGQTPTQTATQYALSVRILPGR